MTAPLNLSALAPLSTDAADLLSAPGTHLAASVDPAFRFGRCSLSAAISLTTSSTLFVILEKGGLTLGDGKSELSLTAGQVAQIGPGTALSLSPAGECGLLILAHLSALFPAGVQRLDLEAALSPSPAPGAAILLTEAPSCQNFPMEGVEPISLGLWAATPYARKPVTMAYSEVMYFLEGGTTLIDEAGNRHSFGPGEVLLAPVGASLAWENSVPVRKLFISADPV